MTQKKGKAVWFAVGSLAGATIVTKVISGLYEESVGRGEYGLRTPIALVVMWAAYLVVSVITVCRQRGWVRPFALVMNAVFLCVLILVAYEYHTLLEARDEAWWNYTAARAEAMGVNPASFLTGGARQGMTASEVDTVMAASGWQHAAEPLVWSEIDEDSQRRVYRFRYSPRWVDPLSGEGLYVFQEEFQVLFDLGGRAKTVRRILVRSGLRAHQVLEDDSTDLREVPTTSPS